MVFRVVVQHATKCGILMPRQAQSLQVVATIKLQVLAQAQLGRGIWEQADQRLDEVLKPRPSP